MEEDKGEEGGDKEERRGGGRERCPLVGAFLHQSMCTILINQMPAPHDATLIVPHNVYTTGQVPMSYLHK